MDLNEIKVRKDVLETAIFGLIIGFEQDTGTRVESIDLRRICWGFLSTDNNLERVDIKIIIP